MQVGERSEKRTLKWAGQGRMGKQDNPQAVLRPRAGRLAEGWEGRWRRVAEGTKTGAESHRWVGLCPTKRVSRHNSGKRDPKGKAPKRKTA